MQLKILGSSGSAFKGTYTTSAVLNDLIALDAGTGMHTLPAEQLVNVGDLLVTHSHMDHIAMLCFWVDSRVVSGKSATIHCLPDTAEAIQNNLLNKKIWPDMENVVINGKSAVSFNIIEPFKTITIKNTKVTPLPVEHGIPTVGFCLHGEKENFVFCSDMIDAPESFWQYLNQLDNFHRMSMEISFPNEKNELAQASCHLTPDMLNGLLAKIPPHVNILYNHIKLEYADIIAEQAHSAMGGRAQPLKQGELLDL